MTPEQVDLVVGLIALVLVGIFFVALVRLFLGR